MTRMEKNVNLQTAKILKNDEFYTTSEDIGKEMPYYLGFFRGKSVYCNCDDYRWSNFVGFFRENYDKLGLSGLTATCYDIGDGAWKYTYDGRAESVARLNGNGDFQSQECIRILDCSDVVVSNPPFSKFRAYIRQLMDHGKKFLVIGNQNAITYKEVFPYIMNDEIWLGVSMNGANRWFYVPDDYGENEKAAGFRTEDGRNMLFVNSVVWFTNIENEKRNKPMALKRSMSDGEYKRYDNYDAIDVSRVKNIPYDYDGVMGVPISFLHKYCPEQFEIVGITENAEYLRPMYIDGFQRYDRPYLDGKRMYSRLLIRKKQ